MKLFQYNLSLYILTCLLSSFIYAQTSKLTVERADFVTVNEEAIPGAVVLTGNVAVTHDGIRMTCNKAYHFSAKNYIKAFGNVRFVQGDTIVMTSTNAEYDGNIKFAKAKGNVVLKDPKMILTTDSLKFNRITQEAYYDSKGVIINDKNTLKSTVGKYKMSEKKYEFLSAVTLTNPDYVIKTNHLDYFTDSGHSHLLRPSTITGKDNLIYTEKGIYNTQKNKAYLLDKSYIKYNNQLIEGDSIYYDRKQELSTITNNIKVTDSVNKSILKGNYAEVYRQKDSIYITKRAVIISKMDNDSLYMHAKQFIIKGKPNNRIIQGYPNVRLFKTDMSGKCDTIFSTEKDGITKLIGKPILWNQNNQLTGKVMHLISNTATQQLDSIKIINDVFLIQKDTLGTGYNQVKGVFLNGKMENKQLNHIVISKNAEVLNYVRNDNDELVGINKSLSNEIDLILKDNQIQEITLYKQINGELYPEKELPPNSRQLRGFSWREDERIKSLSELILE